MRNTTATSVTVQCSTFVEWVLLRWLTLFGITMMLISDVELSTRSVLELRSCNRWLTISTSVVRLTLLWKPSRFQEPAAKTQKNHRVGCHHWAHPSLFFQHHENIATLIHHRFEWLPLTWKHEWKRPQRGTPTRDNQPLQLRHRHSTNWVPWPSGSGGPAGVMWSVRPL